jgi:hypothetical protein
VNSPTLGLDLYWLPLGAGGHSVRWNGRVYEALCALLERRAASALYHSALEVTLPPYSWMIEMTPVWSMDGGDRGVVAEGAVGARWAGRSRLFRYEVHCWRGGSISDIAEAVASPTRLTADEPTCRRLLALLPSVPTRSGAETNWTPGRCGTRTRSPPGHWRAANWTPEPFDHPPAAGRPGGTRAFLPAAGSAIDDFRGEVTAASVHRAPMPTVPTLTRPTTRPRTRTRRTPPVVLQRSAERGGLTALARALLVAARQRLGIRLR